MTTSSGPGETLKDRTTSRRPGRWRRRLVVLVAGVGVLAIGAELVLRFVVGLGDPPLYVLDDQVEYMLKPSASYRRLGNRYSVNSRGMRSAEFPVTKSDARELRVLVVGDSIVNGGVRVDQSELATERVRESLGKRTGRPVVVGNASAGSWGPPNELAYLEKFGTQGADVVVLVLNSFDIDDVPGIESIGPQWPMHTPALALQEVIENYGVRAIEKVSGRSFSPAPKRVRDQAKDVGECLAAIATFVSKVRAGGAAPVVVLHQFKSETAGSPLPAHARLAKAAEDAGASVIDLGPALKTSAQNGQDPFLGGDDVHLNGAGQRLLGEAIEAGVLRAIEPKPAPSGKP